MTLALKVVFDYTMLVQPTVAPTRRLMQVDMYCWHYNHLYGDCTLDTVDPLDGLNNDELPFDHTRFGASRR